MTQLELLDCCQIKNLALKDFEIIWLVSQGFIRLVRQFESKEHLSLAAIAIPTLKTRKPKTFRKGLVNFAISDE